jgi:hypothetical protein
MLKVLILLISFIILNANELSLRKYPHVKKFYEEIAPIAIEVGKKYNIPPASIMAIASVESGYGRGYVAQITGNILSLGANKGEIQLPALYLPYSKKDKKILFDSNVIKKHKKDDLSWKLREKSLKKDYRPAKYRGSKKNLEYFKYNEEEKLKAYKENITDFASKWINKNSKFKAFKEARIYLDKLVKQKGKQVLFEKETNLAFIDMIGGRPNSFNYRKSWPKKVKYVLKRAGLVQLCKDLNNKIPFEKAWIKK